MQSEEVVVSYGKDSESPLKKKPYLCPAMKKWMLLLLLALPGSAALAGQARRIDVEPREWTATWIGAPWEGEMPQGDAPAPEFRRELVLDGAVASARLFICGLGFFECTVNGIRVGDEVLSPNETSYTRRDALGEYAIPLDDSRFRGFRVHYLAYDVTPLLHRGTNVLDVLLGNGFFGCGSERWVAPYGTPRLLCQLEVRFRDGRSQTLVSDTSWQVRRSGILRNDLFGGETFDARANGEWVPAARREAPAGKLVLQTSPADKVQERLRPRTVTLQDDGSYLVDFGDYITGWVRLKGIRAKAGTTIELSFPAETSGNGTQTYICSGNGVETWAPRFVWFAFRKVIVKGWPGALRQSNLVAEAVWSDVPATGHFACSDTLVNRIQHIWWRSQTDNMHLGVATDCPHRERGPYTGDGQVACTAVMRNFDANSFYRKWLRDMMDCQDLETGYVPNGAPWHPGCGGGVAWGAAMNIIPWEHYLHYGDLSVLEECWEAMAAQLGYMLSWRLPDGTMRQQRSAHGQPVYWMNLGEWCPAYDFPDDGLVHTYFLWKCARYTALAARALGKEEEAERCAALAEEVAEAFHRRFYDPQQGSYGRGDGSNVFALAIGVPEPERPRVVAALRQEIEENGGHLNTGIFGTQLFFEVLCDNGLGDLAWRAMTTREQPGYGWWVTQGAQTTWEYWDGTQSRNHPMFGGGLVWLYSHVAGIRIDPQAPAWRHILFKPTPLGDLRWAEYSIQTPSGPVSSRWRIRGGKFRLKVRVPRGSTGTVWLPGEETPVEVGPGVHRFQTGI